MNQKEVWGGQLARQILSPRRGISVSAKGARPLGRILPLQPQPRSSSPAAAPWPAPQPAPTRIPAATPQRRQQLSTRPTAARPWRAARGLGAGTLDAAMVSSGDQCTAWNSSSALALCIRVSMGSWAFMSLTWLELACIANPARRMTRDANQPPGRSHGSPLATRAAAPGAFYAFLGCAQPRALERARPPVVESEIRGSLLHFLPECT